MKAERRGFHSSQNCRTKSNHFIFSSAFSDPLFNELCTDSTSSVNKCLKRYLASIE